MASDVRVICFTTFVLVLLLTPVPGQCNIFGRGFSSVMSFLGRTKSYMQGDTICEFTCSNGQTPIPNPRHVDSANGCGSYGLQLDTSRYPGLTECCNVHDHCYGTCGTIKHQCDVALKDCLQKTCDDMNDTGILTHKGYVSCSELSSMMYDVVYVMGCEAFVLSQDCIPC